MVDIKLMKEEISRELRRQFVHALGVLLVPLALFFGKFAVATGSMVLALAIFILAEHRSSNYRIKTIPKSTDNSALKSGSASQSVMNSIHIVFEKFERSGGNYRGAFYFYLASAVSLFLFSQQVAVLSITVLALGDSFSTAVGIFGKKKIFYNRKKTWEGTIAGFIASFAGCFFINPALALPAAFVGMLVESLPLKIDDNLTIPILTGLALSVITII